MKVIPGQRMDDTLPTLPPTTIERSFRRSLRAMSPPLNPRTMEKGPVISRLGNIVRRYVCLCLSSKSVFPSIVFQNGAAITLAASLRVRP